MLKATKLSIISFVLFSMISTPLFAAKKGNARKGKYLFRKQCRTCHIENGEAKALSPIDKTQAQWVVVFKEGGHEKLACKGEWAKRSEKDLRDIFVYMHNHAFDSPSPMKCK